MSARQQARGMHVGVVFQGVSRRTFEAHLTFSIQIALVANDNDGEVVLVLDAQDLLLECHDFLKALSRRYAVDEEEAFAGSHVLLAHGRVFFLAGRVKHVQQRNLFVNHALLAV
jgi:hypothetical protein